MREARAYVGIDWGDRAHEIAVWDCQSEGIERTTLEQTPAALHEWAEGLRARYSGGRVAVAIEQSRGAVFDVLVGYQFFELYPINPRSAARYREAFRPSNPKDDPTDAASLLDMLCKHGDQLRPFVVDDAQTRLLGLLVEDRRSLVDVRTAHVLSLQQRLKASFPQALEWAGDLQRLQACDFLERWPTLTALQHERPEEVRAFYRARAHGRLWIDRKIEQIAAAVALVHDEAILSAAVLAIRSEVAQIRALTTSVTEYDKQIAALFAEHQDAFIFASFPGAGEQLAPRLLAAFGTVRDRYTRAVEMAERSGIAPVVRRSGKSVVTAMRWAAPKFLRQTFHEFAVVSITQSSWAREFYRQERSRGNDHHAAVRALAYRWIRILFRCWKDRKPYDESLYVQQLARRGSPIAQLLVV